MSSNVEGDHHQQIPSVNVSSSRGLAMADNATQQLLRRLGIVRRKSYLFDGFNQINFDRFRRTS